MAAAHPTTPANRYFQAIRHTYGRISQPSVSKEKSMAKKEPKKVRGVFERPKGSGVWWICYFDQFGEKHREKVGLKSAALMIYQQGKTEVRHGKFEPEDAKRKHHNATVGQVISLR